MIAAPVGRLVFGGRRHIPAGRTAIDAALPGCLARRLARYMARRSSLTGSPTGCVAQRNRGKP